MAESSLPDFARAHLAYADVRWHEEYDGPTSTRQPAPLSRAEVISSEVAHSNPTMHRPFLDIDYRVAVVPSSTDGHYHLYLDHLLSWRKYRRLLKALARAEVIEKGYYRASIQRKHTDLRLPWVKKTEATRGRY